MSAYEQKPFELAEFAANPDPRCACVLLLDVSGSMAGKPIAELSEGFDLLLTELRSDPVAARRVELAVVTFGPVDVQFDFGLVSQVPALDLRVGGNTPMGEAINTALDLLDQRKSTYKSAGIPYYRPWVFLITDGAPTDDWHPAAMRIHDGESKKRFAFFAVGVENADMGTLAQFSNRQPLRLQGLQFRELFVWLSSSLSAVSVSHPDDDVHLQSPSGWAVV